MSSDTAIRIDGLSKCYRIGRDIRARPTNLGEALVQRLRKPLQRSNSDEFWSLRDINLEIKQGEVVGLIGRNGAGKSTLLKVLSRITEPTRGRIELYGRVGSLLEVGTGFHPELSGRENIFLNGSILGMRRSEIRSQFDAIVDFANVQQFLDTPVKRYSSGMYVRLAFAVAAHLNPEILIVDEVLAVGDAEFQKKCLGKMKDVAESGRTVLFVSHNMIALQKLCSHGIVLDGGRLRGQYSADVAIETYLSLIGEPNQSPMELQPVDSAKPIGPLRIDGTMTGTTAIRTADPVKFEVDIRESIDSDKVEVGIVILNQWGQRVLSFHSQYNSGLSARVGNDTTFTCEVDSLPLVAGTYQISLFVGDGDSVIAKHEQARTLEVIPSDFYGTGRIPSSSQGFIVLPCRWRAVGA